MKKIALFSDGTGNSSSSPQKTNVWRTYNALDLSPSSNQIAFYDNGVGTSGFSPVAILGKAFGWGLARNVRQIYGFLCRTYDPGDEIYCFGFSRGAFTIRVVAGLIADQGIVDRGRALNERDLDRLVAAAYHEFRKTVFTPSLLSFFLRPVRDFLRNFYHRVNGRAVYQPNKNIRFRDAEGAEPLIRFVGVWDTVDAYGLPIDEFTRAWDKVVWPLTVNDRSLSRRVGRACHALALDEQRESFEPMLWNEKGAPDGQIMQVWFPGVHSNVGGGYPDDGLAFISLNWMLAESAKNGGLTFLSHERNRYRAWAHAPVNDSRAGAGAFYRYAPRQIERLCKQQKPGLANWLKRKLNWLTQKAKRFELTVNQNEVEIARPKIHHSVMDRLARNGHAYAPINLPASYALVQADGSVIDIGAAAGAAGAAGSPLESEDQARLRRVNQSYVWTKVWSRKMIYLAMLALVLLFAIYPGVAEKSVSGKFEPLLGTLSEPLRALPELVGKIPGLGMAESWASSYADFPMEFSLGIVFIGLVLFWSSRVNAAIKDEMRTGWSHLTGQTTRAAVRVSAPRKWWAGILDGKTYRDKIETPLRIGMETVAVLLFVFLVVAGISRVFFVAADGTGWFCKETDSLEAKPGAWIAFDPRMTCANTGLELRADRRYSIYLEVSKDWRDANIAADVTGWREAQATDGEEIETAPWYLYLLTPLRRHMFAGWYQPVARIDGTLFDRYPLKANMEDSATPTDQRQLCMTFTARRSGPLFVYLNDAVLFEPGLFYDNNRGTGAVMVTELQGTEKGCSGDWPAGSPVSDTTRPVDSNAVSGRLQQ